MTYVGKMNSNIELDSESLTHRGEFKPWWNLYFQHFVLSWASLVAQMVKYLPAMWKTLVWTLGQEDSLEKGMASHSSILAWGIPWTEEPDGYSPWGRKESDMTERLPPPPPPFLSQEVNEGLLSPFQSNIIISSTKAECSLLISVDILFPFRTVYSPFHISKGTWIVVLSFYYQNLKFKG